MEWPKVTDYNYALFFNYQVGVYAYYPNWVEKYYPEYRKYYMEGRLLPQHNIHKRNFIYKVVGCGPQATVLNGPYSTDELVLIQNEINKNVYIVNSNIFVYTNRKDFRMTREQQAAITEFFEHTYIQDAILTESNDKVYINFSYLKLRLCYSIDKTGKTEEVAI